MHKRCGTNAGHKGTGYLGLARGWLISGVKLTPVAQVYGKGRWHLPAGRTKGPRHDESKQAVGAVWCQPATSVETYERRRGEAPMAGVLFLVLLLFSLSLF
jgi:hypothetical protein